MPTNPETLLSLAERIEKATADEQRAMLIEAFEAVHGPRPTRVHGGSIELSAWLDRFNPFFHMLEANAFESAALTLADGLPLQLTLLTYAPDDEFARKPRAVLYDHEAKEYRIAGEADASTPALALTAAALRARAAK